MGYIWYYHLGPGGGVDFIDIFRRNFGKIPSENVDSQAKGLRLRKRDRGVV